MVDSAWSWVQFSDIHLGSPRSFRFQPSFNQQFDFAVAQIQKWPNQPDFVLVSGDLCRDGDTHLFELEAAHERLQQLPWPVYCLPGNHDVGGRYHLSNPVRVRDESVTNYRSVFGPDFYSFKHKEIRFLCLDSMIMGSGLKCEAEQWVWLEQEAVDYSVPTMVLMHSLPFTDEPGLPEFTFERNPSAWYGNIPEPAQLRLAHLCKAMNLIAVSSGHIHVYTDRQVDGIRHVMCPSTAFLGAPEYLRDMTSGLGFLQWNMGDFSAQVKVHALEQTSSLQGYGPGGNIPKEKRDYSVAWER